MIPLREIDAGIIDRVTHSRLADVISVRIESDESWSPTIQAEVVRTDIPIQYPTPAIRNAQGDWLTIEAVTHFGPRFQVAALTHAYGGEVATVTARHAGSVERITAAHVLAWHSGEQLLPLSAATAMYGGEVANVTAAVGGAIDRLTWALRQPGGAFHAKPSERVIGAFKIREIITDKSDQTVTYRLVSADIRFHDYRRTNPAPLALVTTSLRALVGMILAEIPDWDITSVQVYHGPDVTIPTGTIWKTGQTGWDVLAPILEAVDYRLYADLDGTMNLAPRVETAAPLILDKDTNLTEYTDTLDYAAMQTGGAIVEYSDLPEENPNRFDIHTLGGAAVHIIHETRSGTPAAPGAAEWLTVRARARARSADATTLLELTARPLTRVQARAAAFPVYGTIQSITHDLTTAETRYRLRDITS